ncbi:MAG: S16 family serine protease [Nanoarchaeota archaeon]
MEDPKSTKHPKLFAAATVAALIFGIAIFLAIALLASALAENSKEGKEYHLKLLAVSDEGKDGKEGEGQAARGITADLYLKITPGTGNVFIETEPVTKLDTRISTKLAKDIACESMGIAVNCDSNDFFFRIEANASLVGGPSAGAAAAAIAVAAVEDAPVKSSVAITGTINSGGLIGSVGGLKEKINAAAGEGLKKVLIPSGERFIKTTMPTTIPNATPKTLDLVDYGKSVGIEVVEISDIQEALFHLTGKKYQHVQGNIGIDKSYSETMKKLADEICSQTANLYSSISLFINNSGVGRGMATVAANVVAANETNQSKPEGKENVQRISEAAKNLTSEGLKEKQGQSYYAAASMCFGANVRYSYLILLQKNMSNSEAQLQINATDDKILEFERSIPEAKTLAELQVRGLVRERLEEARELLEQSSGNLEKGNHDDATYQLAYAKERLGSASAWNRFLTSEAQAKSAPKTSQIAAEDALRSGCITRLQEAEEHMQYLDFYLPGALQSKDELGPAYAYLRQKDHSSCIYRSSLAKAKANAMLSALSGNENISALIGKKLEAAKSSIARQTSKGEFPIISYSYYEYANTLKQSDQPSALLFSEYALELSSLNIYLKPSSKGVTPPATTPQQPQTKKAPFQTLIGFAAGAALVLTIMAAKRVFNRRKRLIIRTRTKPARITAAAAATKRKPN